MPDHTPVKASETSGVQNQPKNTSLENPDLVKNSVLQVDTAATSTNSSEPRSPDSLPELSPTSTTSTSTSSQQTASQQVEEGSREYSWDELNNMSHEELLAISAKLGLPKRPKCVPYDDSADILHEMGGDPEDYPIIIDPVDSV